MGIAGTHRRSIGSAALVVVVALVAPRAAVGDGYGPAVHSRAFTKPHDLEIAPGFRGRLGVRPTTEPGSVVELVTVGAERAVSFRVDSTVSGATAALHQPMCIIEQFTTERNSGRSEEFTKIYLQFDVELDYPDAFPVGSADRFTILELVRIDGVPVAELAFAWSDGAFRWLQLDGPETFGPPVPPAGSRFQLRLLVKRKTGGGVDDGVFQMWQRIDGATWAPVFDLVDRSTSFHIRDIVPMMRTRTALPGATLDPALRVFSMGWAATEGYNASAPGGESYAANRVLLPYLDGKTDDEVFDHLERDPTHACMTLDTSATEARLRVALDPGEGAADWPGLHARVRYGLDAGALGTETSSVSLDDPIGGHAGFVVLDALLPGTRYYWEPVFTDDPVAPRQELAFGRVRSFVTKDAIGTASAQRRIIVGSCAKSWGGHLPYAALYWAGHLGDSELADPVTPEVFILEDDISYPDEGEMTHLRADASGGDTEGGAAYDPADYARVFRQWHDDLAHQELFASTAVHLTYGDHLVHNNWGWPWWHTADGGTSTEIVPDFDHYPLVASPRKGELVENAMSFFERAFAPGLIGTSRVVYENDVPANLGRIIPVWRSWKSGRCHFIQLDTRSFKDSVADANKMIGDDQFAWFVGELSDPSCPLKIILSPSPVGDFMANFDNWAGERPSRTPFLQAMNDHLPAGHEILLVTGDRHIPFVSTALRNTTVTDANGPVPACIAEVNACPIQSAFPGVFTAYDEPIDEDPDILWCLRGSDSKDPGLNNTSPDGPGEKAETQVTVVLDIDEIRGVITVTFLDGTTGAILDDGKGNTGRITLIATSLGCAADVDADGMVGFTDLVLVLGFWGGAEPTADVNGDGTVGLDDVILVLTQWGPCG